MGFRGWQIAVLCLVAAGPGSSFAQDKFKPEDFQQWQRRMRLRVFEAMQYIPSCTSCGPRPAELTMEVDWVRVWQR